MMTPSTMTIPMLVRVLPKPPVIRSISPCVVVPSAVLLRRIGVPVSTKEKKPKKIAARSSTRKALTLYFAVNKMIRPTVTTRRIVWINPALI